MTKITSLKKIRKYTPAHVLSKFNISSDVIPRAKIRCNLKGFEHFMVYASVGENINWKKRLKKYFEFHNSDYDVQTLKNATINPDSIKQSNETNLDESPKIVAADTGQMRAEGNI